MSQQPSKTYRVARRVYFSAAHQLRNQALTHEENLNLFGIQAATHGLGHNYILEAYIEGALNEQSAMIMPVAQLDALLKEVVTGLDHKFLNKDVPYFREKLPTTENVARYCHDFLSLLIQKYSAQKSTTEKSQSVDHPPVTLQKIRLYETEDLWVDCGPALQPEF